MMKMRRWTFHRKIKKEPISRGGRRALKLGNSHWTNWMKTSKLKHLKTARKKETKMRYHRHRWSNREGAQTKFLKKIWCKISIFKWGMGHICILIWVPKSIWIHTNRNLHLKMQSKMAWNPHHLQCYLRIKCHTTSQSNLKAQESKIIKSNLINKTKSKSWNPGIRHEKRQKTLIDKRLTCKKVRRMIHSIGYTTKRSRWIKMRFLCFCLSWLILLISLSKRISMRRLMYCFRRQRVFLKSSIWIIAREIDTLLI